MKVDAIQQTKEAVNENLRDQIKKLMKQTTEDSTTIINLKTELGIKQEFNDNTELLEDIESKTQQILQLELQIKKMEKETRLQNDQKAYTITDLNNQVEKLEVQLEMKNQKLKEYVSFKKQHDQYANDLNVKQQKISDLKKTIKNLEDKLSRE